MEKHNRSDHPMMLYLKTKEFNLLITVLDAIIKTDEKNEITKEAAEMKETIMRFTKKEKYEGEDRAAVILYEREACPLLKLTLFFVSASIDNPHDYFSEIRKKMKGASKHERTEQPTQ